MPASPPPVVYSPFELPTVGRDRLSSRVRLAPYSRIGSDGDAAFGIIARPSERIDAAMMDAAGPSLRIVANYAVGFDNVDLEAARSRSIVVTNTPGVLDDATADLAFALLLAVARRIPQADAFVRSGRVPWRSEEFLGFDVSGGRTLGIVGLGNIGMAMARRAHGFGMDIVATGSRASSDEAAALSVRPVSFEELLDASDVISLHCPLTESTRHLIGRPELARMRPGSILINTSRGPVVDERALVEALQAGKLGGAGLDVFENEPTVSPELISMPHVVLAPHIGSAADTTRNAMARLVADNLIAVLDGRRALTPVGS